MIQGMIERRKALTLTVVLVFLCSVASYVAGAFGVIPGTERLVGSRLAEAEGIDLTRIREVQRYITEKFVDEVSAEDLAEGATEGALRGMMEATGDRYSVYFTPTEYQEFLQQFEGSFTGIGVQVELSPTTGLVTVVAPFKGSPGEQAGLKAGDAIIAVDGQDVQGMTLEEVVQLIRGPEGSQVTLTVQRGDSEKPLEFVITRATIEIPVVESRMVDDGVGYVRLTEFSKGCADQVKKAIEDLRNQGATRLIFDLRQNGGGLLDEAIGVASLFIPPKEPVVHIVYRDQKRDTYRSRAKENFDMPLVVLVDGGSASASEIVAGAIKDLKAGVLMGVKTFGKGSVQTFYELSDGSGIKLTTAKYLTAGGNSIHEVGIEPDVVVENTTNASPGDASDIQLQKAIEYIKTMQ